MTRRNENLHIPSNSRFVGGESSEQETNTHPPVKKPAIFLDRDGVVVEERDFLNDSSQLNILPGVSRALQLMHQRFYLIVVTNQSGVGRGLFTEETLFKIHLSLVQQLAEQGSSVDALYYCPHYPEAEVPEYRAVCQCRKPKPGMVTQAAEQWGLDIKNSFLVGDRPSDIEAAEAAGIAAFQVGHHFNPSPVRLQTVSGLLEAAEVILARDGGSQQTL